MQKPLSKTTEAGKGQINKWGDSVFVEKIKEIKISLSKSGKECETGGASKKRNWVWFGKHLPLQITLPGNKHPPDA